MQFDFHLKETFWKTKESSQIANKTSTGFPLGNPLKVSHRFPISPGSIVCYPVDFHMEINVSRFPSWKSTEDFHRVSLEFPCWETQEYWQWNWKTYFMTYDDIWWHFMTYDDIWWHFMTKHVVYHDIPWHFMTCHDMTPSDSERQYLKNDERIVADLWWVMQTANIKRVRLKHQKWFQS